MFQEEVEKQRAEGEKEFRRQVILLSLCPFYLSFNKIAFIRLLHISPGGGGPGDGGDELHAAGRGGQSGGGEAVQRHDR